MINCEQLALDYSWNLTRKNACHISVQNTEMGEIKNEMLELNLKMDMIFGGWAIIVASVVVLVIKKMWGSNKSL